MNSGRKEPRATEGIEPDGTYRPQYRVRWRGLARMLDRIPRTKSLVAGLIRRGLRKVFEPGMVTTERVVEYPFVFQNLSGVRGPVLDVGCCHSRMPMALASRGFRVVGIDVAPYPYAHPGMQAVQWPQPRLLAWSGGSATESTISARSTYEPAVRVMSWLCLPLKPMPARSATARSRAQP